MNVDDQQPKPLRVLSIYERLRRGETISKKKEAERFGVNEKTIQRDIDELRTYIADTFHDFMTLEYDRKKNGYVLKRSEDEWLTNEEILVIAKVLLESRALKKTEMDRLLKNLFFNHTRKINVLFKRSSAMNIFTTFRCSMINRSFRRFGT
jgi:predicted DNA-binding transcriptional regulator YafY